MKHKYKILIALAALIIAVVAGGITLNLIMQKRIEASLGATAKVRLVEAKTVKDYPALVIPGKRAFARSFNR